MAAAEIIAQRDAPYLFGEVGRAIARPDQIADDGFKRPQAAVAKRCFPGPISTATIFFVSRSS
jgi:hypothetical protein